jgi:hypothetical protein
MSKLSFVIAVLVAVVIAVVDAVLALSWPLS